MHIRYYKLLYDEKNCVAYTNKTKYFLIAIRQFDWIDEFNVFLETDGQRIESKYVATTLLPDDLPKTNALNDYNHLYSIFRCEYTYTHPCNYMEAHWFFRIRNREFWTESMQLKVLERI